MGQVPSESRNLVSTSNREIIEGPHKNKRRHRVNTRTQTVSPPPQEVLEPKVEPKMIVSNSISKEKEEEWMKSL